VNVTSYRDDNTAENANLRSAGELALQRPIVGPDEGAYLPYLDLAHKVSSESFEGAITIVEWGLLPGVMIPPHTHSREQSATMY
jgi:hypothetical protein